MQSDATKKENQTFYTQTKPRILLLAETGIKTMSVNFGNKSGDLCLYKHGLYSDVIPYQFTVLRLQNLAR